MIVGTHESAVSHTLVGLLRHTYPWGFQMWSDFNCMKTVNYTIKSSTGRNYWESYCVPGQVLSDWFISPCLLSHSSSHMPSTGHVCVTVVTVKPCFPLSFFWKPQKCFLNVMLLSGLYSFRLQALWNLPEIGSRPAVLFSCGAVSTDGTSSAPSLLPLDKERKK